MVWTSKVVIVASVLPEPSIEGSGFYSATYLLKCKFNTSGFDALSLKLFSYSDVEIRILSVKMADNFSTKIADFKLQLQQVRSLFRTV